MKKWCAELKERNREKWCEECCVNISAANFKRHRRLIHSREKSAICPVTGCGKNFYHNRYLDDHLRSAHRYDNLQCAEKYPIIPDVQLESGSKVKIEDCFQEKVLGTISVMSATWPLLRALLKRRRGFGVRVLVRAQMWKVLVSQPLEQGEDFLWGIVQVLRCLCFE